MTIGNDRTPYRVFAKLFCTWSSREKLLRLGRIVWANGRPGDGKGYTAKLSLALMPSVIGWCHGCHEWSATLLGCRIHYQRSYGGWMS